MKIIKLDLLHEALVDDQDFELVSQYHWTYKPLVHKYKTTQRAYCRQLGSSLEHFLMQPVKGRFVYHLNGNRLDCRRENMVILSRSDLQSTRPPSTWGHKGYKGVSWNRDRLKWVAGITINGKHRTLGYFTNETTAALAYNSAAMTYHGDWAYLNEVGTKDYVEEKYFRFQQDPKRQENGFKYSSMQNEITRRLNENS